eukprot:1159070-Pelagomonas_calceolata.AAC.1
MEQKPPQRLPIGTAARQRSLAASHFRMAEMKGKSAQLCTHWVSNIKDASKCCAPTRLCCSSSKKSSLLNRYSSEDADNPRLRPKQTACPEPRGPVLLGPNWTSLLLRASPWANLTSTTGPHSNPKSLAILPGGVGPHTHCCSLGLSRVPLKMAFTRGNQEV